MVASPTRRAIERVFAALDWPALGEIYCDEGGDAFWAEHRQPTLELGCRWGDALARRVQRGGSSLYVGAGVAELPAMLCEAIELDRGVVAANRRTRECEILERAVREAGVGDDRLRIHDGDARECARGERAFDHLGLVSVLTDPETWPVLAGVTYGRLPPVVLDVEAFVAERAEASALVDALAGALVRPAVVTTTVDELPWLLAWADRNGVTVRVDDEVVDTAVVGDPIGFAILE